MAVSLQVCCTRIVCLSVFRIQKRSLTYESKVTLIHKTMSWWSTFSGVASKVTSKVSDVIREVVREDEDEEPTAVTASHATSPQHRAAPAPRKTSAQDETAHAHSAHPHGTDGVEEEFHDDEDFPEPMDDEDEEDADLEGHGVHGHAVVPGHAAPFPFTLHQEVDSFVLHLEPARIALPRTRQQQERSDLPGWTAVEDKAVLELLMTHRACLYWRSRMCRDNVIKQDIFWVRLLELFWFQRAMTRRRMMRAAAEQTGSAGRSPLKLAENILHKVMLRA